MRQPLTIHILSSDEIVEARIIIKPMQPSYRMVICRLLCLFVCHITDKKGGTKILKKKLQVSSLKYGVLSGSPLSNDITQQRSNEMNSSC